MIRISMCNSLKIYFYSHINNNKFHWSDKGRVLIGAFLVDPRHHLLSKVVCYRILAKRETGVHGNVRRLPLLSPGRNWRRFQTATSFHLRFPVPSNLY